MIKWSKLSFPNIICNSEGKIFKVSRQRPYNNTPCAYVGGMREVPTHENDGYKLCTIDGRNFRVHRLIAEAFLGKCPEGKVVDHINRDRLDNRIENLRYATITENNRNNKISLGTKFHCYSETSESVACRKNLASRGYYRTTRNGKYCVLPLSERIYK